MVSVGSVAKVINPARELGGLGPDGEVMKPKVNLGPREWGNGNVGHTCLRHPSCSKIAIRKGLGLLGCPLSGYTTVSLRSDSRARK